jgi:murein DD-endopeptidase MepM/ murein hydrolase activator NlpD
MRATHNFAEDRRSEVRLEFACKNFRRELALPPKLAGAALGLVAALLVSCLGIGAYPVFRDDMLASLMRRQARMQRAYEDRIADLRGQIDAISSQQARAQDALQSRLAEFSARQAQLETRAAQIAALAEQVDPAATTIAVRHAPAPPTPARPAAMAVSAPVPDGFELRGAHPLNPPGEGFSESAIPAPPEKTLGELTRNFDRIEQRQIAMLDRLGLPAAARAQRLRQAIEEAGLPVERLMRHAASLEAQKAGAQKTGADKAGAMGGPFEPAPAGAGAYERAYASVSRSLALIDGLRRALPYAPLRQPLPGPLDVTSSFGLRIDPFLGRPALHGGMDLRGDRGDPVRATAVGRVVVAGPSGGYGNLVEIDHGAGLVTRYGHLSQIAVEEGQWVEAGAFLGQIGSTGRSTGPHLHYEVRVDGAPVDPVRYLRAGRLLNPAL